MAKDGKEGGKMRTALSASIVSEEQAVEERFTRADSVLGQSAREVKPEIEMPEIPKVVRDSFTMPEEDYKLIQAIREQGLKSGVSLTKAEVLRAGLHALKSLAIEEQLIVFKSLAKVPTGRPGAKQRK